MAGKTPYTHQKGIEKSPGILPAYRLDTVPKS
jgi:hypothetical protein